MKIYKDKITGDELFSDVYKIIEKGALYEVEGQTVTRKSDDIDESLIGGNASAEEVAETVEGSSESGVDIVLNHKLQETGFNKKEYAAYIKSYVKAIKEELQESEPERVDEFVITVQEAVRQIMGNFKNYKFFTGESMSPCGMVGLLDYREDEVTPFMLFFKDGLLIEKL